ncbi:MAG TPA: hypothetical protein VM032_13960 [Vicinamibacterales bacterium]|nr:hypothetical protein [Vicinamibacterales bacterium]
MVTVIPEASPQLPSSNPPQGGADGTTEGRTDQPAVGGWVRVLALLLTVWEPVACAVAASGAFNAISVRGVPVAVVLGARLASTALCVAAGRSLLDRRPAGPRLARVALIASAAVQLVAYLTPFFPSNRLPGETPVYVAFAIVYYGAWLTYLARSKRVTALQD